MTPFKTVSVCNTCGLEIPALVCLEGELVVMHKVCPEHGFTRAVLERDAALYWKLRQGKAGIYPGHFIDVTERCNLACPYCYYPVKKTGFDRSMASIVSEAATINRFSYLAGGEPTLRDDLPDIMRELSAYGGAGMPTNGTGLANIDYLKSVLSQCGMFNDGLQPEYARIALSWHSGINEKIFWRVIENLKHLNQRIAGPIFVLRSLDELPGFMKVAELIRPWIAGVRIHVETAVWSCQDEQQIFLSDLLRATEDLAKAQQKSFIVIPGAGLTMWLPTLFDGLPLFLIRWNTKENIDLPNVSLEPSYTAHNGEVVHMIHGYIINEFMAKGWLKGRRIRLET